MRKSKKSKTTLCTCMNIKKKKRPTIGYFKYSNDKIPKSFTKLKNKCSKQKRGRSRSRSRSRLKLNGRSRSRSRSRSK